MENIKTKLEGFDWQSITESMNDKGSAIIPQLLSKEQCQELINNYDNLDDYRKTVVMERYRFGLDEYKYFSYPLPNLVQTIRESVYPKLAPIANLWMKVLKIDKVFPNTHLELQKFCQSNNQLKPTALILKYSNGGYNTLHQDLYGEIFFPMQIVLFLNAPDEEYTGGEFVLTQQIPRAQSKAIVLKPKKGDMLIFTTNFYPIKGNKGYYRVNMKHGVSEIHNGERYTLGIIFHDALN
ncbi:2OG-Fe(II) oxygenase [Caldithrix abyssi]|nr:2OG-Fe(II) oxygenase [Caldithrix abyssi]